MTSGYKSTEDIYTHIDICRKCIHDENIFNTFKIQPAYTRVLEHCSIDVAVIAIKELSKKIDLTKIDWTLVAENDKIGSPVLYNFKKYMDSVKLDNYMFSPSTIQYVYQAVDILTDFVEKDQKKDIKIVEVGGGYGGLCKTINVIAPIFGITISKYYLIDLPDVCTHQNKYLKQLGITNFVVVPFNTVESSKIIQEHDLFISIYALGEFTNDTILFYINNVIVYSNHVYIWWNLTKEHEYFKNYRHLKTGILHNHPCGLDMKIID